MTARIESEHGSATHAMRAAADVVDEADEGGGFCASVLVVPGRVPVVHLARALRGAPHEGDVLRWVMERCAGAFGPGLFVRRLQPSPRPTRFV